jgi:hypothetical protein
MQKKTLEEKELEKLNNREKQEVTKKTKIEVFEKTNEINKNSEISEIILERLEKIEKQNEKIISFYELLKKEQESNDNDNDMQDAEIENSAHMLRSFKVNSWLVGEFLRVAKKKEMKVQTATNKAFRMFIEKYD